MAKAKWVIDAGNSSVKAGIYRNDRLEETAAFQGTIREGVRLLLEKHGMPAVCLVATVREAEAQLRPEFEQLSGARLAFMRSGLRLPVKVRYKTPETLGNDRLANACAAAALYPESNVLVMDAGTCLKLDLVNADQEYLGGSISPGLSMRYKALSRFTSRLPLFEPNEAPVEFIGQSTEQSIRSGVEHGMLAEMDGMILEYRQSFENLNVILTGGDAQRFDGKLKSTIFVAPNLTLSGLKAILDCNENAF